MRIAELKKDAYEFKRDIVVGAENMRTGRTVAEKVVRYMEEKLRARDSAIEKLRLKNATVKSHIAKVEAQLKQKEEMGDVLHYIDFHQLQIENKQYVSRIEERNEELLRLKMTTGKTVQTLNALKHRLGDLLGESEGLTRDIDARAEQLRKARARSDVARRRRRRARAGALGGAGGEPFRARAPLRKPGPPPPHHDQVGDDNAVVGGDIAAERRVHKRLGQQQAENQDMPQVLDYVGQKAEMYELQHHMRNWERKVEIMEMAAKRARKLAQTASADAR